MDVLKRKKLIKVEEEEEEIDNLEIVNDVSKLSDPDFRIRSASAFKSGPATEL